MMLPDPCVREGQAPPGFGEKDLCRWLGETPAGDVLEYHRGHLAADRDKATSGLPNRARRTLDALARRALRLNDAGHIALVQRRLCDGVFAYLAVKASKRSHP